MFGFWRYLSTAAHHHPLWIPYPHTAFTAGTSRTAVDHPVGRLHHLRNRIAHHEPLLRRNGATGVLSLTTQHLVDRQADLLTVAELILPRLRDYIAATSTVRDKIDLSANGCSVVPQPEPACPGWVCLAVAGGLGR
jgi:Abi-like protein.